MVLKLKTKEFTSFTRSLTPPVSISSCEELANIALALRERVDLPPRQLYRLVGVGLRNFRLEEDAPGDVRSWNHLRRSLICFCKRSSRSRSSSRMITAVSARENQAPRSTSGVSMSFLDRGGHSTSQVLLTS